MAPSLPQQFSACFSQGPIIRPHPRAHPPSFPSRIFFLTLFLFSLCAACRQVYTGFMCPARGADALVIVDDSATGSARIVSRHVASSSASPSVSPSVAPSVSPSATSSSTPSPSSPCTPFNLNTNGALPANWNPGPYTSIRVDKGAAIDYVAINPGGTVGTVAPGNTFITSVCGGAPFVGFGFKTASTSSPSCIQGRRGCQSGHSWSGLTSIGPFACQDGTVDPTTASANSGFDDSDYEYTLPPHICGV